MKEEPLVSVLMNCYNGEKYLREAVDSVLAQGYRNWELVFWDNRSTDNTAAIFKSYSDSRLKYFLAPEHTDLGGARARAWEHVRGEFVAVLDADDIWLPQKLERQMPYFDDPEVGLVASDTLFFNEITAVPLFGGKSPPSGWVTDRLLEDYFVSLETLVFRRSAAMRLLRVFDAEFSFIADFDLVIRLSCVAKLAFCPEILAKWRVHGTSDTWRRPHAFVEEKERWLAKQIATDPRFAERCTKALRCFSNKTLRTKAAHHLLDHRRKAALQTLMQGGFDHWQAWVLLVFCFLPFSDRLISYLYKRKLDLR